MKIEEGKIYKRRDGLKAFDIEIRNGLAYYYYFELNGNIRSTIVFESSGSLTHDPIRFPYDGDLIEEWKEEKMPKSPVVEKTVKSIEPGVYGIVNINNHMGKPMLTPKARNYTPEELESAAKTFMELAEYLRWRG